MYWTDRWGNKVQRATLRVPLRRPCTGLRIHTVSPWMWDGGKMSGQTWLENKVQRANLDGSNVEDLVTGLGSHTVSPWMWMGAR